MNATHDTPQEDSLDKKNKITSTDTVILGAGVIGLATAYYLALAFSSSKSQTATPPRARIIVIDPSSHICLAASGQATGGLGDFGFGPETAELGKLSYALFQEIAEKASLASAMRKCIESLPKASQGRQSRPIVGVQYRLSMFRFLSFQAG